MNTVLNQIAFEPPIISDTEDKTNKSCKYIIFKTADYLFALPSENILKVVATPPPSQGGMVSMGLVQLGQYSIRVLNLLALLSLEAHDSEAHTAAVQNPPFLMVLKNTDETLWGIAVHEPPELMDIAGQTLNLVPPERRLFGTLQGVSHVGTCDLGDRHTLLILDLPALFAAAPSTAAPLAHVPDDASLDYSEFMETKPPIEIEPPLESDEEIEILFSHNLQTHSHDF